MAPAISVGSVEVDVIPNAQGIRQRMQRQVIPAAEEVGDEVGRVIGRFVNQGIAQGVVDGVNRGMRQAQAPAARQGMQTGSAFARGFKGRLEAALRDLPEVHLNANSTDAEREIYQIRAQLQTLRDVRIGIDVSQADAVAAMDHLRERLARLSASDADVAIRVDAGAAQAQLAAFQAEINRLDGQSADVDVDTHAATANLGGLTAAAIAFGPAILPVLPVVAAGLGAIAAAAAAAGAGIGAIALVAVPAFKQIGGVLQAQKAAQDAASQATLNGGQAAAQASSRALQLASAQAAVTAAERNGARQIAQAQQQVTQARQAAAQTAAQASLRSQQAARAVQDAERALSDAQKAATKAQQDLTAARQQATRELQDMNNSLADAQLSQRQAELDLADAKKQRDAVFANNKSTQEERDRAQLAYDQAVQSLREQQLQTRRLKKDTDAANKAGVDGSKTVKTAQQQLAQAQQAVADKARALKDAQAAQARTATENARQLAAAQQRIADAQASVANAQTQAAEQAASAHRQLQQAQLASAGGADAAATAQAKYQEKLNALSPAARQTLRAFLGLKSAFTDWSKALQPAVMPIFTRALDGLRSALPALTPFVLAAAGAIKDLQDRFSKQIKTPFWRGFKKDLQGSVKPAITGLGVAFGNVITGMAGVIDAFLPHMDGIGSGLQGITKRFADWGKGLKGSPTFERFLAYAADKAPLIGHVLGQIASAFLAIGQAMAPVAGPLLQVIGGVASAVGSVATYLPELVLGMYAAFVATKLWAVGQLLVNGAMIAFRTIAQFGPWGWIILGITAVVLAVTYMYRRFSWFRDAVQTVWQALQAGAMWLWTNGIKPAFDAIALVVTWLWSHILKPYLGLAILQFKATAAVVTWLWKNIMSPTFHLAADLIVWWWKAIVKPQFELVKGAIRGMASTFKWLYDKVIKPVWQNGIAPTIEAAWKHGIKPYFESLKDGAKHLGDAFKDAKDAIAKHWSGIKSATKAPINFVIGTIWNKGIVESWKSIRKWVPDLPKLDTLPLLARGGTLPVQPGVFNKPTAIVGEGRPQHPEFVIPTDPRYRGRALALWQAAGTQLLAGGGILGDVLGGVKSFGGKIGGLFSSAKRFLTDPGKALDGLFGKLLKPLNDIRSTAWGRLAAGLPKLAFKGLKDLVTGGGAANVGPSGGAGVKRWTDVVHKALQLVGQPLSYTGITLRRMNQESGGNPTIVNTWDSNWMQGHPSVGLMQVIRGTFQHYAGRFRHTGPFSHGVSTNPLANVYASMRYALAAYGSLPRAYNRAGGYDAGGWMPPGMNLMYNGLGRPEAVLTPQQWSAIQGAAAQGSSRPGGPSHFEGNLYLDSGEFLGRVRGEAEQVMQAGQQQLVQVLNAN